MPEGSDDPVETMWRVVENVPYYRVMADTGTLAMRVENTGSDVLYMTLEYISTSPNHGDIEIYVGVLNPFENSESAEVVGYRFDSGNTVPFVEVNYSLIDPDVESFIIGPYNEVTGQKVRRYV